MRRPDKEIELKVEDYKPVFGKSPIWKKPILRGVAGFVESLVVGTKCLMYSAEIAGDEEEEDEAKKKGGSFGRRAEGQKGKRRQAVQMASVCDGCGFHCGFRGGVYAASLCAGEFLPASGSQ